MMHHWPLKKKRDEGNAFVWGVNCTQPEDQASPYTFIAASNRDEVFHRPTEPAGFWEDHPDVLAGRDINGGALAGGTWLGITRGGRFSVLTNYRSPKVDINPQARSRGAELQNPPPSSTGDSAGGFPTCSSGDPSAPQTHTVCFDHPNHIVVVDTRPSFGPSLSSMAPESEDEEPRSSQPTGSTQQCSQKGVPRKKLALKVNSKKRVKRLRKRPS